MASGWWSELDNQFGRTSRCCSSTTTPIFVGRSLMLPSPRIQGSGSLHGARVLALCEQRQFDVVILDLIMPGMTGIEVLEKLKVANGECEVILLTGQGTIETAVKAMKLGAYDYVRKPFRLSVLEVLIEKACERRQLRKETQELINML